MRSVFLGLRPGNLPRLGFCASMVLHASASLRMLITNINCAVESSPLAGLSAR